MKTNPNDLLNAQLEWGPHPDRDKTVYTGGGLTKREYFAIMSLQGLASDPNLRGPIESFTKVAVEYADSLIEELNKGNL